MAASPHPPVIPARTAPCRVNSWNSRPGKRPNASDTRPASSSPVTMTSTSMTRRPRSQASARTRSVNIRSRSSRLARARSGSLVFPAMSHSDPRRPNAARRKRGVGHSQTACAGSASSGCTRRGSSRKPSAITPGPAGRPRRSPTISPKPSPRNQWNVSSMTCGDRLTQRWSMSMAANSLRYGLSAGRLRRP